MSNFKKELQELLIKHGYSGVMYNIKITNVSDKFVPNKDLSAAYDDNKIIVLNNIIESTK